MDIAQTIIYYTIVLGIMILAICVHEASHAIAANICGDKTALMLGRATLNPTSHIDPIGTVVMPALTFILGGMMFGWARPVPIREANMKDPKKDPALVAAAGPFSNFALALIFAALLYLTNLLQANTINLMKIICTIGIQINISFMILNFLPIPPLDGSRVLSALLPRAPARALESIEPYGTWIVLALAMTGVLSFIIKPLTQSIVSILT